jgi:hypothetical protein
MPGFGSAGRMLQVGPLLSMADEKPAGRITGVWEKAVHAGHRHRWIKNNLGLPVFVRHHIVVFDADAAKGLALGRQTISKHAIPSRATAAKNDRRTIRRNLRRNDGPVWLPDLLPSTEVTR